jgi:hypothetical protein
MLKRLLMLVSVVAALAVTVPAVAAPPPDLPYDPFTHYLLVRLLPNGTEKELAAFEVTSWDDQEQLIRSVAFQAARQQRTNNPSWRLILYGPVDPPFTYWTDDDRIWGSWLNE